MVDGIEWPRRGSDLGDGWIFDLLERPEGVGILPVRCRGGDCGKGEKPCQIPGGDEYDAGCPHGEVPIETELGGMIYANCFGGGGAETERMRGIGGYVLQWGAAAIR